VADAPQQGQGKLIKVLTTRSAEEATALLLKHAGQWRTDHPKTVEIVFGPCSHAPAELPTEASPCKPGITATGLEVSVAAAARSLEAVDLLKLLDLSFGDVTVRDSRGVTPMHLAALSGSVPLVQEMLPHALRAGEQRSGWRDADGRTPLHYAVFFDSTELVSALAALPGSFCTDRWNQTPLNLAEDLGHVFAAKALGRCELGLHGICGQRLRKMLQSPLRIHLTEAEARLVAEAVPLHDYWSLAHIEAASPGAVDPVTLQRSMSCFECWYADVMNRQCSGSLSGYLGLIRVWESLVSFRSGDQDPLDGLSVELTGSGLSSATAAGGTTVAGRLTFLKRLHQRTGGVLDSIDWRNVCLIGGMVLACLVADDDEYARNFQGTDVDLYIVGLRGEAYREKVKSVVAALPPAGRGSDHVVEIDHDQVGISFARDSFLDGLVITGIYGAAAKRNEEIRAKEKTGEPCYNGKQVSLGDLIVGVDDEISLDGMVEALRAPRKPGWKKDSWRSRVLTVRPKGMIRVKTATVVRSSHTLTACLRDAYGKPLPNVQVVLAPYGSVAHLLFTTDIDCTAIAFDGQDLWATPRAREAIRYRRNVVRPEKYSVRGEWRTEARLLKYAARGFRVLDPGVAEITPSRSERVHVAAREAEMLLKHGGEVNDKVAAQVITLMKRVRDTELHGAELLFTASKLSGLHRLLLFERPLLRPGLDFDGVKKAVEQSVRRVPHDDDDETGERPHFEVVGDQMFLDEGYGRQSTQLLIVNPHQPGRRVPDGSLRGIEGFPDALIQELDIEADRFEVRGWYDGVRTNVHSNLPVSVWRGIGDFRKGD
jgi:ankyrin repeat protein